MLRNCIDATAVVPVRRVKGKFCPRKAAAFSGASTLTATNGLAAPKTAPVCAICHWKLSTAGTAGATTLNANTATPPGGTAAPKVRRLVPQLLFPEGLSDTAANPSASVQIVLPVLVNATDTG